MLDIKDARKRAEAHTIGEIDRDALAADYLRLQAETLEEVAENCETPATVSLARWFQSRVKRTRAELKKLDLGDKGAPPHA